MNVQVGRTYKCGNKLVRCIHIEKHTGHNGLMEYAYAAICIEMDVRKGKFYVLRGEVGKFMFDGNYSKDNSPGMLHDLENIDYGLTKEEKENIRRKTDLLDLIQYKIGEHHRWENENGLRSDEEGDDDD